MKTLIIAFVLASLGSVAFATEQKGIVLPAEITVRMPLSPDQVEARRLTIESIARNTHPTARVYTEARPDGGTRFIVVRPNK